jgi:DNA-binding IclR family transcriptional regulator
LVIAAIGVSGPIERLRPARLKSLSADLIRAADGITAALRGDAPHHQAPVSSRRPA